MSVPENLPKGLWIGTAVFALLSAAGVYYGIRFGRDAYQRSVDERMERSPVNSTRADSSSPRPMGQAGPRAGPAGDPAEGENQREAAAHWNVGLIAFQKGSVSKARDEWTLCAQLDPAHEDCRNGLERLERLERGREEAGAAPSAVDHP